MQNQGVKVCGVFIEIAGNTYDSKRKMADVDT